MTHVHYSWFQWHLSGNGQNMNFGFWNFFWPKVIADYVYFHMVYHTCIRNHVGWHRRVLNKSWSRNIQWTCTTLTPSYPSLFIISKCSRRWFWVQMYAKAKVLIFSPFFLLIEFGQIKQKVENGSCSRLFCVTQHDFKCMYDIPYESTHSLL